VGFGVGVKVLVGSAVGVIVFVCVGGTELGVTVASTEFGAHDINKSTNMREITLDDLLIIM